MNKAKRIVKITRELVEFDEVAFVYKNKAVALQINSDGYYDYTIFELGDEEYMTKKDLPALLPKDEESFGEDIDGGVFGCDSETNCEEEAVKRVMIEIEELISHE